jgi:hypothetical protein
MGTFRRVEADQAGPEALGILVPPGKRTFVILRPRALPWDAVLCKGADDLTFAQLAHDEASAAAQGLYRALKEREEVVAGVGTHLHLLVGPFVLVVCARVPGQPYTPLSSAAAPDAAERFAAVLDPEGEQELYFNVRFFER